MPGTAKLAAVRLAAFVLLLVLAPVPSQAQTITNYKFAIVATQESMPDIIPSIEFALNDSKAALEAANATVELVQVALPAVPLFPLQHVSLLEYALLQQQFVAVINAMNDPVALAAIDNTTVRVFLSLRSWVPLAFVKRVALGSFFFFVFYAKLGDRFKRRRIFERDQFYFPNTNSPSDIHFHNAN